MTPKLCGHLIAADVGNSAVKLGRFQVSVDTGQSPAAVDLQLDGVYPTVVSGKDLQHSSAADPPPKRLEALLLQLPAAAHRWFAVSVNRQTEHRLANWIRTRRPQDDYTLLHSDHFPVKMDVRFPDRVGTDRLAAAVAANELRSHERPAIIVDAGTAITVDVVTADGVFRGGAILPGLETSAAALAAATDALPLLDRSVFSSTPAPIGKSTEEALRSGIVWGCVGGVRELISRMAEQMDTSPEVFCTGGDGLQLARLIGREVKFDPNLVLHGIALTGFQQLTTSQQQGRHSAGTSSMRPSSTHVPFNGT